MKNHPSKETVILSLICCLVCAVEMGCRGGGAKVGAVSMNDSESAVAEQSPQIVQASFRTEGPDGKNAESSFHSTVSGLKYRVLRQGNGKRPTEFDRVQVSYRGWLDDGTVFDSSYERGKPITFELRKVVKGWTEGMQYVSEGGKIELEIPSNIGYGPRGQPPTIPPHATLHFIVELHEVY